MATGTRCELAILIFNETGFDNSKWDELVSTTLTSISETLRIDNWISPPSRKTLGLAPSGQIRVVEIITSAARSPLTLPECCELTHTPTVQRLQQQNQIELVIQPHVLYQAHRTPGLAVFDMDSTLIQQEVIDELARVVGVYDQVSAITEAAMRGEPPYTDFEASLRARVALLKGVPETVWRQLREQVITFTPGVKEVCLVLKRLGWKLAVLSGGFTPLALWVQETLGLDYAHANFLEQGEDGLLTGELVVGAPIVHAQRKQELLLSLAAEGGFAAEQTIAVGDGSNDLLMMAVAGLGVAFNAKPKVQLAAPTRLNSSSMIDLLHILGYDHAEIQTILVRD